MKINNIIKQVYLIILAVNFLAAASALAPKAYIISKSNNLDYYMDKLSDTENSSSDIFKEIDALPRKAIFKLTGYFFKRKNLTVVVDDGYNEDDGEYYFKFLLKNNLSQEFEGHLEVYYNEDDPSELIIDAIWLDDLPHLRGKRIMPVLYRWLAAHPYFSEKFKGWKIWADTTEVSAKAWMRGSIFSPAKRLYQDGRYYIFGNFPLWEKSSYGAAKISAVDYSL